MLKLNRNNFFSIVRNGPFPGKLTQNQVDGMNDLLDCWEEFGTDDPRHLSYTLATNFHETGQKMQPVREGFKATDAAARKYVQRHYGHRGKNWYCWPAGPYGHVYYGRGDVQNTWLDNYSKMEKILGIPLVENPDLALQSKVSKRIMVEGMLRGVSSKGDFTGKALEDYFNDTVDDPVEARRIVNGKDKANLIAAYHKEFLEAVLASQEDDVVEDSLVEGDSVADDVVEEDFENPTPAKLPPATDETSWGGVLTVVGGLSGSLAGITKNLSGPAVLVAIGVIVIGAILIARGRRKTLRETGE